MDKPNRPPRILALSALIGLCALLPAAYALGLDRRREVWEYEGERDRDALRSWAQIDARGLRDGLYRAWHASGQLAERGEFEHGYRAGHWETWYENGQPSSSGDWSIGLKCGDWLEFDREGRCTRTHYTFTAPPAFPHECVLPEAR